MEDDGAEYECSDCGTSVAADARTCPNCGMSFDDSQREESAASSSIQAPSGPHCVNCGATIYPCNTLCDHCADRLTETESNETQSVRAVDASHHSADIHASEQTKDLLLIECPKCETPVTAHDSVCPGCGVAFDIDTSALYAEGTLIDEAHAVGKTDNRPPFHSTMPMVRIISWILIILTVVNVGSILFSTVHIGNISAVAHWNSMKSEKIQLSYDRLLRISEAQIALYIIVITLFLNFIYQSYNNLLALGVMNLKNSPVSSVGKYFIPLLNIIHPYSVFTEIWKACDPSISITSSWQTSAPPQIVKRWWIICLLILITAVSSFVLFRHAASIQTHLTATFLLLIANGLAIVAAVFTTKVTKEISHRQEQKKIAVIEFDKIVVRQTRITEQESTIPIPYGYWLFGRILKSLETPKDSTESLRRRLKGLIWLIASVILGVVAYAAKSEGMGILAVACIIYGLMLVVSGMIGESD